jgi:hypothetical protein
VTDALTQMFHTITTVAPKALLFLAILAVGYFAARIISRIVTKLLLRAGFNRLLDKARLAHMIPGGYGNELVGKLTFAAVLLVALQLAFGVFGPNPVSSLITSVIAYLPRIAVALALVVVAGVLASHVRTLVYGAIGNLPYGRPLAQAASVFVVALGVIAALGQVGVAVAVTQPILIAALATAAGVVIVGVGGGLIKPAQAKWETYLANTESAAPQVDPDTEDDDTEARQTHKATIVVTTKERD